MEQQDPADTKHAAPRHSDPPRPAFGETLPITPEIRRPWLVHAVAALVFLSAILFVPYTVDAAMRQREVRSVLEDELAERSPDYPTSDVELAVLIGVVGLLVLSILLVLAELRCAVNLRRKVGGARTWLLILTMAHVPIIAMSPFVRQGGEYDDLSALVQGACLLLAVALAYLPPVGKWLRAVKRQGPIPLRTSTEPPA